jgi:hypothetical protein
MIWFKMTLGKVVLAVDLEHEDARPFLRVVSDNDYTR